MRKTSAVLSAILVLLAAVPTSHAQAPFARAENSVVAGKARFQVLSPTLIRMELAPDGEFVDAPSAGGATRGGPVRPPDRVAATNRPLLGEGVLSRSGYYLYDDSNTPLISETTGWIEPR